MQVRSTCAPRTQKWLSMSYFLIEVKMLVENSGVLAAGRGM